MWRWIPLERLRLHVTKRCYHQRLHSIHWIKRWLLQQLQLQQYCKHLVLLLSWFINNYHWNFQHATPNPTKWSHRDCILGIRRLLQLQVWYLRVHLWYLLRSARSQGHRLGSLKRCQLLDRPKLLGNLMGRSRLLQYCLRSSAVRPSHVHLHPRSLQMIYLTTLSLKVHYRILISF
jgi:hypothetical protein